MQETSQETSRTCTRKVRTSPRLIACVLAAAVALNAAAQSPGSPPADGARLLERTLRVGAHERRYLLFVPRQVAKGKPLLIALHGGQGTPAEMRGASLKTFEQLANEHGFVIAYPEGYGRFWHDCRKQTRSPARDANVDDVAFLRAIARTAAQEFESDLSKLYLFGFSAGGHMAQRFALEAPGEVAAIAVVAATLPPPETLSCAFPARIPRVMLVAGTNDDINPYGGGAHFAGGTVLSAQESAAFFARAHGLTDTGAETTVKLPSGRDSDLLVRTWMSGQQPKVSLYTLRNAGHMVPSPAFSDLDAALEAWKFFNSP